MLCPTCRGTGQVRDPDPEPDPTKSPFIPQIPGKITATVISEPFCVCPRVSDPSSGTISVHTFDEQYCVEGYTKRYTT